LCQAYGKVSTSRFENQFVGCVEDEAQAEMTITKLYHQPDCTHPKDRDTACSCTLPFPLELSKTEKQAEERAANSTDEANMWIAPTIFMLP
jgi:hypothetical protein